LNSALERFTEKQMIDGFEKLYLKLANGSVVSRSRQQAA